MIVKAGLQGLARLPQRVGKSVLTEGYHRCPDWDLVDVEGFLRCWPRMVSGHKDWVTSVAEWLAEQLRQRLGLLSLCQLPNNSPILRYFSGRREDPTT